MFLASVSIVNEMASLPTNRTFSVQNEIRENASQVYVNKMQCSRLCQRIDQLIDVLERLEYSSPITIAW